MTHGKIYNLEKNGHIKIYKNKRGYQFVSLSELEIIIQQEKKEAETLIIVNTLDRDEKYKHLHLNWNKVMALIQNGELEEATTISGYKAVSLSSFNKYIDKLQNKLHDDSHKYASKKKLLTELKNTNSKYQKLLSRGFLDFAVNNGVEYKKSGRNAFINLESLDSFINEFETTWFTSPELIKMLNISEQVLYKVIKDNHIESLKLHLTKRYHLSTIKAALEIFQQEKLNKKEELEKIKQAELEIKKENQMAKQLINLQQAIKKLKKARIPVNSESECLSLLKACNIQLIDFKEEIHVGVVAITELIENLVTTPILNEESLTFCIENKIKVINLSELKLTLFERQGFEFYKTTLHYSTDEAIARLNVSTAIFRNIVKETIKKEQILISSIFEKPYYLKVTIDNLVSMQNKILSQWFTPKQAHEFFAPKKLQYYTNKMKRITTFEIPTYLRHIVPIGKHLYNKEDIYNLVDKIEKNKQFDSLDISAPAIVLETAVKEIYNLQFHPIASKTEEIWFYFVKKALLEINRSEHATRSYIKQILACTELLIKATEKTSKEIFTFTSNEMNLYFMGRTDIPKDYKRIFHKFITELHNQLQELAHSAGKKSFNINNVISINDIPINKKKEKDIYPFHQYLQLYDFANNITYHKKKAIEDVRKNIKGLNCSRYDSMWLFILINLNNPWNHEEITLLPNIDLTKTKITSLEWLENNDIDLQDATSILMQFRLWDSKRLKTGIKQNFHISSELLKAFATAAAICELRFEQELLPHRNMLIDFKTSSQRLKHTHKPYTAFFNGFDSTFRYENLKLARSIISYKNVILSEFLEPDDNSLKFDRGHAELETTNIYVQLPKEHIDFLCKQLFARDFLGNIYYNLSNIFYAATNNRIEQTDRIVALKERFGSVLKIEGLSGILNQFSSEQNTVRDIIYNLDSDTVASIYNKLNCNTLPAKEKDYQCLNYPKGCLYPERNCSRCPLAIPNYLAIMRIVDNILTIAYEMQTVFKENNNQKRIVLANKFHQYLLDFGACISQFSNDDKEEIYKIISIEREDFLSLLSSLPEYQKYISYQEKLEVKNDEFSNGI